MEIIRSVLTEELYLSCVEELKQKFEQPTWVSSLMTWDDRIKVGITGSCLTAWVSESIKEKIYQEIKKYLPNSDIEKIRCRYYIWQYNSGISWHNDGMYKFAGTIYLNDEWHVNDGGLFVWLDKTLDELRVIIPQQNTMVLNTKKEGHLVTPVSSTAQNFRYTIQVWGEEK